MKTRATAATLVVLALTPVGQAFGAESDSGAAPVPPEPQTGAAVAPEPVRPPATPEPERESQPGKTTRPKVRPAVPSVTQNAVPEPSLGGPHRVTQAQSKPRKPESRRDMDVVVPVPDQKRRTREEAPPPVRQDSSGSEGLPRAGLDVLPLALIGLALMLAGLTVLRLSARRLPSS